MMKSSQRRRRRSLRPTTPDPLMQGCVVRAEPDNRVTVEIVGGPPGALATIQVAGSDVRCVQLDACGTGTTEMPDANVNGRLEVNVDGRVLLTGHLPAGSGA